MVKANRLIRKEYCFLTPDAEDAMHYLRTVCGVEDQDFALTLLEKILGEQIYDLDYSPQELKERSRPCRTS